nr:hypothetical protein [Tanacetum cinerariifolium]
MTLKDFLHFPGNHSASFSSRPADVPMSVGSHAGSAANVPNEELQMAIVASLDNNAFGAKVVPLSVGRRWWGVVARPIGSLRRVIAPFLDVDSKGKIVTFPNSAGSPSFKKKSMWFWMRGPLLLSLTLTLLHLMKLEKAILVGRSQALRDVASLGIGVELVEMKDFDPNAELNYDIAIESFYQTLYSFYGDDSVPLFSVLVCPFGQYLLLFWLENIRTHQSSGSLDFEVLIVGYERVVQLELGLIRVTCKSMRIDM